MNVRMLFFWRRKMNKNLFMNKIKKILENELEIKVEELSFDINLNDIGVDSIALMTIIVCLESEFDCEIEINNMIINNHSNITINDLYKALIISKQ